MVIGKQMDGDGGDRLKSRVECRFFEEKRVVSQAYKQIANI